MVVPIESPTSTQETVVGVYLAWYWADDQPWPRLAQGYGNRLQIVASRNGSDARACPCLSVCLSV